MKPIPIFIQKILAFIPLVNTIGIFVLLYQCYVTKKGTKLLIKSLILLIPTTIVFGLLMAVLDFIFTANSNVYQNISYFSLYLFPLIAFLIIIYAQKRII